MDYPVFLACAGIYIMQNAIVLGWGKISKIKLLGENEEWEKGNGDRSSTG